jgi:septum formation protein
MPDPSDAPLILASRSEARANMLRAAGVAVEVLPAAVDEVAIKEGMHADGAAPRDIADTLAEYKARRIAGRAPGLRVLGADQVLVCEGKLFDKPRTVAEAREQLAFLRGRDHELLSAAVIYENATPVWRHIGRAVLRVRPFSDAFLDDYVAGQGDTLLATVGAYRLEAEGAQLFSHVQGDYFTILGLPLLEVLGFLRTRGMLLE